MVETERDQFRGYEADPGERQNQTRDPRHLEANLLVSSCWPEDAAGDKSLNRLRDSRRPFAAALDFGEIGLGAGFQGGHDHVGGLDRVPDRVADTDAADRRRR